jgi:GT2 family glycosyltransferase
MGLSLTTMAAIGPFDETASLNGAEDNDWGYRALRIGVPIVYAPEVAVTHLDWRDAHELSATYRRYARAQGGFYGKHLRGRDRHIAARALRDLVRGPWLVLRAAVTRNPELAVIGRAEAGGILPGIVAGYRDARRR